MAVGMIYWSYDDITYTLNISGNPLPTTSMNGSYDINVDTSESADVENIKHFMHDGTYVDSGGEYFVPWGSVVGDIQSVNITDLSPLYMGEWFDGGENITTWNLSNVDFSECISFSYTFQKCKTLPQISDIVVSSNATTLRGMFYQCANTTSLNLSHWDVSNVTDARNIFRDNSNLEYVNVSNWDTSNMINMSYMFATTKLRALDVSNWDTSNVTNMSYMFYRAELLSSINVSNWNVGNVTNMRNMFNGANSLATIDVSDWDVSNVTDMGYMFSAYYEEGGMEKVLASIDVSNWDVSNVVDMSGMFNRCKLLTTIDVGNWDVSNVVNMTKMFRFCRGVTTLDVGNWDVSNVTNMNEMFYGTLNLISLDVSNWNTSKVTNMDYLFSTYYVPKATTQSPLDYLDVSNWNTSQVTTMKAMFQGRINLTSIDVSNWNVSKVTDMSLMFDGRSLNTSFGMKLEELHLEKWKTNNVVNTKEMFYNCPSLTKIYVGRSDLDMSNVTTSTNMFYNCIALSGAIPYDSTKTDVEYANYTDGYFTALVTPRDFLKFTIRQNALDNTKNWGDVVFGKDVFVTVCKEGGAFSYDGVSWVESNFRWGYLSTPTIMYGKDKFIMAGIGGEGELATGAIIHSSVDGVNWKKETTISSITEVFRPCAFNGSVYALVSGLSSGTTSTIYTSTDGATWIARQLPNINNYWNYAVCANNKFIAIAKDVLGTNITNAAFSTDGITWTTLSLPTSHTWKDINVVNNMFVLIASDGYMTSTDGTNWSAFKQLPYPKVEGLGMYLAETTNNVVCSDNLNTWLNTNVTQINWNGYAFGVGKFVLLKSNGTTAYTTDSGLVVFAKQNNQWIEGGLRIKANNTWLEPSKLFVKQNNTWTEI